MYHASRHTSTGYTLIELIMVMVIVGALAAIGGVFIIEPFRASADMTRRAALVDQADLALDRIRREVHTALPNSVRLTTDPTRPDTVHALEFVATRTGGRYRRLPAPGGGSDPLNRAQTTDSFDVLGGLPAIDEVNPGSSGGTDCGLGDYDCISIYNTGQSQLDIYQKNNVAAVMGVGGASDNDRTNDTLTYNNAGANTPAFGAHSPRQRFFVTDTVVSYVCDPNAGTIRRYSDYGLRSSQPLPSDSAGPLAGLDGAIVASEVSDCEFEYQLGASSRRGLLKARLALSDGGETITLFAQSHVLNAP